MRRTVLSAIGALGVGAVVLLARQASPAPPTFHAGVDVVQLDVTVLDKQQEPVPGLTANDFVVLEDGKPRPIVAFSVMEAPEASPNAAPWTRVVPLDVVTNQLDMHRLMVIVLDDRLIPAGMTGAAAAVANRAIDRLGPGDEAAVVFTAYGQNQNLTTDHAALHQAVASLSPHPPSKPRQGKTDPGMVGRIAGILQNAPVGRKILLSISPAPNMGLLLTDGSSAQDIRRELQAANITVYTFDLRGVQTSSATADQILTPHGGFAAGRPIVFPSPNDLSVLTGGRAIVGTNDPWDGIENVYRESRLYYLIGFDRGAPADGKLHDVSVKVNRPGVEVRTRSSYVAPGGAPAKASAAPHDDGSAPDPVDEALAHGLPGGDLPLRVVITPVAAADGKNTVLVIGTEIGRMPSAGGAPPTQRVNLVATALDKDWNARQTERQTVDLSTTDGASGHEVLSRLSLAHGRYDVRVAAESGGHTGNVFVDVDVPDLVGPDLALSGVFLSQHPGVPAGPRDALVDLVPVVPATTRTFSKSDHVTAFVRVYEGRSGRLRPATVTTGIVNDQNARVFEHASSIAATAFGSDRSADVSLDLPLDQLSHGDYVVAIEVTDGDHQQYRYERFSMN